MNMLLKTDLPKIMPCCQNPTVVDVPEAIDLRFHPRTPAKIGIRITRVCARCGALPLLHGLMIHDDDLIRISAPYRVNEIGDAAAFGFPQLPQIVGNIAPGIVIPTEARYRFDEPVDPIPSDQLESRLRSMLGFGRSSRPKAFNCPGVSHPIILHTGLSEKFATIAKDGDHCRFVTYTREVIESPAEVWLGENDGREVLRILGVLGTQGGAHFMNVVAEADNHLCDTAYIVAHKPQTEGYRTGKLLYVGWGIRI